MRTLSLSRSPVSHALALAVLAALPVQADVSVGSAAVGGPDTSGCSGADDPPTLDDGLTLASGRLDYAFDSDTHVLSLTVTNTSAVTPGVPNPLITDVYLNLPHGAVTGVSLVGQTGAGGAAPGYALALDASLLDGSNANKAGCFGAFNLLLSNGAGIGGGIANADADTIPGPGGHVVGPVVFELAVSGPGVDTLSAKDFENAFSHNPPGDREANAALKFQGGGIAGASDKIGNGPACEPGAWMTGEPCLGNTVTFTMSAAGGCHGCMLLSRNGGPTTFLGETYAIAPPLVPFLVATTFPMSNVVSKDLTIPNKPSLVGKKLYFIVGTLTPANDFELSDAFSIEICDAP